MQIIKSVMFTIANPHDTVINAITDLLRGGRDIDAITPELVAEVITIRFTLHGECGLDEWENNCKHYHFARGWFKAKGWDAPGYLSKGFGSEANFYD